MRRSLKHIRPCLRLAFATLALAASASFCAEPGEDTRRDLSKNELRNWSRSPLVLFQKLTSTWTEDHRPLQFEDASMTPERLCRKRYLEEIVEETVRELPEHHQLVFRLRELEGKSYEEISEITGVNLGTVKSRLHRARHSFAKRIEPLVN